MIATVRSITAVVLVVIAVAVFRPSSVEAQGNPTVNQRLAALESQVAELLAAIATLQGDINAEATARAAKDTALQTQIDNGATVPQNLLDLADYVSVNPNTLNDLAGPHVIFSGANVHIRNGIGLTAGSNGLGNLIVGYDETVSPDFRLRDGSHNVVVGQNHGYSSFGGLVVGDNNIISGPFASISGGGSNSASGSYATVSGGAANSASSAYASVSGGFGNTASGQWSTVSGGANNIAAPDDSHVP